MVIILILVMVTFSLSTHNSITISISITYVEPLLDIITIRLAVDHAHNITEQIRFRAPVSREISHSACLHKCICKSHPLYYTLKTAHRGLNSTIREDLQLFDKRSTFTLEEFTQFNLHLLKRASVSSCQQQLENPK